MANSIPHQFYNDYTLPSEFYGYPTTPVVVGENGRAALLGGAMWSSTTTCDQENLVPYCDVSNNNNNNNNNVAASVDVVSPDSEDISSSILAASFPELLGIKEDMAVPAAPFSEYGNLGLHGISSGPNNRNFGGEISQTYVCSDQFGEECCTGLMSPDLKAFGLGAQENRGTQGNQQVPTMDQNQSAMKVGRYSEEERKERIGRYLKKRNQRNFNKTIKYACRKTLADRRVRVRGRFARNTELSDHHQEIEAKNIDNNIHTCKDQRSDMYCISGGGGGPGQMKYAEGDDCWLQEAMTSLMYLPYVTSGS